MYAINVIDLSMITNSLIQILMEHLRCSSVTSWTVPR